MKNRPHNLHHVTISLCYEPDCSFCVFHSGSAVRLTAALHSTGSECFLTLKPCTFRPLSIWFHPKIKDKPCNLFARLAPQNQKFSRRRPKSAAPAVHIHTGYSSVTRCNRTAMYSLPGSETRNFPLCTPASSTAMFHVSMISAFHCSSAGL